VDIELAKKHVFNSPLFVYTERDVMLYALGIGEATNPIDDSQLQYAYENHPNFKTIPTFGVLFPFSAMMNLASTPGLSFNPMMLLHGEQSLEVFKPLPTFGSLTTQSKISNIYDKGKGALVILDAITKDDKGQELCKNQISLYIRGIGGFGGERGPAEQSTPVPKRSPDAVLEQKTLENQALWYRLCGDYNPLHADPNMASMGGFEKPILHGLCSFGFAARGVIRKFCNNDPDQLKGIKARFTKHVFPGETIITELWQLSPTEVLFQCRVKERPDAGLVLSNGLAKITPSPKSKL